MTFDAHGRLSYSTVATAPSPAISGTTLVVAAGTGALFPIPPFNCTVWPAPVGSTPTNPTTTNSEIVRVTGVSTDTLTITRAQEGSSARTIVITDQIANTETVKTFTDIETAMVDITSTQANIAGAKTFTTQLIADITGASAVTAAFRSIVDTSTANQPAIWASNNTNFAHGANILLVQMLNASDSGKVLRVENSGTGKNISSANGSTETFSVDKIGHVFIATGTNASAGTGTLSGGTVTISTTAVTSSSLIFLQDTASSITNVGTLTVSAKTAGTSFVVTSTLALDTSTFSWMIVN